MPPQICCFVILNVHAPPVRAVRLPYVANVSMAQNPYPALLVLLIVSKTNPSVDKESEVISFLVIRYNYPKSLNHQQG
jgi:hypothetical protein